MTRVGDFQTYGSEVSKDQVWDRVHVVLSQWDLSSDYTRHAGATILSLLVNCSLPVTVHIFHSEQQAMKNPAEYHKNVQRYVEIIEKYSGDLELHDIVIPSWVTEENRPRVQTITPAALFRLYIPSVLTDIDFAIYLDCDIIVNTDLAKLSMFPLTDHMIAACLDQGVVCQSKNHRLSHFYKKLGIDLDKYFNSGFMVMNLKKLRGFDVFLKKSFDFLYNHPEMPCLDQEALNFLLQNDCYFLDPKYNVIVGGNCSNTDYVAKLRMDQFQDCILHYAGNGLKPWMGYSSVADLCYWKYFSQTPWCGKNNDVFYLLGTVLPTREECILRAPEWILVYTLPVTLRYGWHLIWHTIFCLITYYTKEIYKRIVVWKLILIRISNKLIKII